MTKILKVIWQNKQDLYKLAVYTNAVISVNFKISPRVFYLNVNKSLTRFVSINGRIAE